MAGWLDRWARRAADATPATSPQPASDLSAAPAARESSRRDFLKKAGIVGGVAWSVPVMQSVMAPAASASANTPLGGSCNDANICNNGASYCNGAICGGLGALCGTTCWTAGGISCGSGTCGGVGASCTSNVNCNGRPCAGRVGDPKTCGGPGAACSTNAQCTYSNCNGSVCGGPGALCPGGKGTCATGNCTGNPKTCT